HPVDQAPEVVARVRVEAAVHAARDDDPAGERLPEPGGQREPVLVVQGVFILAEQHLPRRPTVNHYPPLRNTNSMRACPRTTSASASRRATTSRRPTCSHRRRWSR